MNRAIKEAVDDNNDYPYLNLLKQPVCGVIMQHFLRDTHMDIMGLSLRVMIFPKMTIN
jgi:hypothetical protein